MSQTPPSRKEALARRLEPVRRRGEELPGAPLALGALRRERELAGELLAGGVAFRVFLWLVPFGLVVAVILSLWSEQDAGGLEAAARRFGVGAAAARAAVDTLQGDERSALVVLVLALPVLAWTSLRVLRAISLAYALAWGVKPPPLRHPGRAILLLNGWFFVASLTVLGEAWFREEVGWTALILGTGLALACTAALVLYAMWLLPHRASRPRELLPGAVLVAVGHQLVQVAVLVYFAPRLGESEETLGAFGAAAVLLVWLYFLTRLAIAGAFLNVTIWTSSRTRNPQERIPV